MSNFANCRPEAILDNLDASYSKEFLGVQVGAQNQTPNGATREGRKSP
jgi:hypothetical protein